MAKTSNYLFKLDLMILSLLKEKDQYAYELTKEIAEKSIYDYLENTLGVSIVTSKRIMTVEKMTEIDEKYLDLGDYNCMAVVSSHTYNSDGVMFEYTQSRHRPDYFSFQDNATRQSI